jgi:hypothetical protein
MHSTFSMKKEPEDIDVDYFVTPMHLMPTAIGDFDSERALTIIEKNLLLYITQATEGLAH